MLEISDLPNYYGDLEEIVAVGQGNLEEIVAVGQGSFGVVFKAKSKVHGCVSEKMFVKKLLLEGEEDQKEFIKEARMLHHIKRNNVENFKALCQLPYAIMLEYLYFDFSFIWRHFPLIVHGALQ